VENFETESIQLNLANYTQAYLSLYLCIHDEYVPDVIVVKVMAFCICCTWPMYVTLSSLIRTIDIFPLRSSYTFTYILNTIYHPVGVGCRVHSVCEKVPSFARCCR